MQAYFADFQQHTRTDWTHLDNGQPLERPCTEMISGTASLPMTDQCIVLYNDYQFSRHFCLNNSLHAVALLCSYHLRPTTEP